MNDISSKIKMPNIKKAELFVIKEERTKKEVVPIDQVLSSDLFRKIQQSSEQNLAMMYPKIGSEIMKSLMMNPGERITSQTPFMGATLVDPIRVNQLMAQQQMSMMQNPGPNASLYSPGLWSGIPGQTVSGLPIGWPNQGSVDPRIMTALQQMGPAIQQAFQSEEDMEKFLNSDQGKMFLKDHPYAVSILTSRMGMKWLLETEKGVQWLSRPDGHKRMIDIVNAIRSDPKLGIEGPAQALKVIETAANFAKMSGMKDAFSNYATANALSTLQSTSGLMQQPNLGNPQPQFAQLLRGFK